MREIKFNYIFGVPGEIKTYFRESFTLNEIENRLHSDCLSDSPMYRDYRIIAYRQFTGSKCKDGVEIYEGDILEIYDQIADEKYTTVVGPKGLIHVIGQEYDATLIEWTDWLGTEDIEVIGNIHMNPELLEIESNE